MRSTDHILIIIVLRCVQTLISGPIQDHYLDIWVGIPQGVHMESKWSGVLLTINQPENEMWSFVRVSKIAKRYC